MPKNTDKSIVKCKKYKTSFATIYVRNSVYRTYMVRLYGVLAAVDAQLLHLTLIIKKTAKFVTAYKNDKLHGFIIEYTLKAYKNKHFIHVT